MICVLIISDLNQIPLPSFRILAEVLIGLLVQFSGERALEKRRNKYKYERTSQSEKSRRREDLRIIDNKILPALLSSIKQKPKAEFY